MATVKKAKKVIDRDDYFGEDDEKPSTATARSLEVAQRAADIANSKLPDISVHPLAHAIPREDRVIVRRDVPKKETRGGILLPDSVSGKKPSGVVHRIGPGKRNPQTGERIPIDLEIGQRVLLTDYAGLEIRDPLSAKASDDEYVILRDEDIICVLPS